MTTTATLCGTRGATQLHVCAQCAGAALRLLGLRRTPQRAQRQRLALPGGETVWIKRQRSIVGDERIIVLSQFNLRGALLGPGGGGARLKRKHMIIRYDAGPLPPQPTNHTA